MKRSLLVLTLLFLCTHLKSEFGGYHITFAITFTNGGIVKGYAFVPSLSFEMDSAGRSSYLKMALDQDYGVSKGFTYFTERITYLYKDKYRYAETGKKSTTWYLTGKKTVPLRSIRRIRITNYKEHSSSFGIANPLTLQDTAWMNKEPLKSFRFEGYLCFYDVFVHEGSSKTDSLLKLLKIKCNNFNWRRKKAEEKNEEESQDVDGYYLDKIDKDLERLTKKLYGEKVIVIWYCTC